MKIALTPPPPKKKKKKKTRVKWLEMFISDWWGMIVFGAILTRDKNVSTFFVRKSLHSIFSMFEENGEYLILTLFNFSCNFGVQMTKMTSYGFDTCS